MSGIPPLFESIRVMNPGLKRPSGPARAGFLAALLAGLLPLIAALLLALIAGTIVYALARVVSGVLTAIGVRPASPSELPTAPIEPERENVRVRR